MTISLSLVSAINCTNAVETYRRYPIQSEDNTVLSTKQDKIIENDQTDSYELIDYLEYADDFSSELDEIWVQNKIESLKNYMYVTKRIGILEQSDETGYYYDLYDFGLKSDVFDLSVENSGEKSKFESDVDDRSDDYALDSEKISMSHEVYKILQTEPPVVKDNPEIHSKHCNKIGKRRQRRNSCYA